MEEYAKSCRVNLVHILYICRVNLVQRIIKCKINKKINKTQRGKRKIQIENTKQKFCSLLHLYFVYSK